MTINALIFRGRHEPIEVQEISKPDYVTDDFVSVKLKSAALNRRDYWITKGLYPDIADNLPAVLGSDGCGIYEGNEYIICPNVNWGDGPFPSTNYTILGLQEYGTFADQIFVRKNKLYRKPDHLSSEQAACLPLAGLTAYRALFTRCQAKKGQKVLISGIGGGVALFACQFAIAIGAEVYVTSGDEKKIKKAIALGAVDGVSYKDPQAMKALGKKVGGFDVVIDSAGGKGFNQLLKMCKLGANVGIYGGTAGTISGVAVPNLFFKQISIHGSTMGSDEEFKKMIDLVNEYKIVPVVYKVRSLQEGNTSINDMSKNEHFGKFVLNI